MLRVRAPLPSQATSAVVVTAPVSLTVRVPLHRVAVAASVDVSALPVNAPTIADGETVNSVSVPTDVIAVWAAVVTVPAVFALPVMLPVMVLLKVFCPPIV